MYWRAQQLGEPVLLSPAEMEVVVAKFRTYGQPDREVTARALRDAAFGDP